MANLGNTIVNGALRVLNGLNVNTINGVTVGSSPKFTDTDTKVTAVGNHYAPAEDTNAKLSADASSTTAATWNSTSLVTGVDIKRDAKGHVVGVAVDSIKMPANPNTNTTYTFATGDANGQIKVTPSGGTAQNVNVKGLGSAAYTASTAYAAASHTHGNIQNGGTLQSNDITIASGDKLVVTDSSDSNKVARTSIAFDGSTATKALTQKGTWESFTNNAGTITGIKMNGASKGTSGVVDLGTVLTSHQDISGKVNKSGDTMTGQLTLAGNDLKLGTTGSSSDDCSDIAWFYGNGQEKARLWTQNEYTAESGLNFRLYKKDGTSLFSGTIPLRNTWRGIQDNLTSSTNTTESLSAKQGYLLANGSARDNTKVAKSGDTMTGNLTIKRTSTNAENYSATLTLSTVDSTNNVTSTGTISAYQAGVNGSTLVVNPNGNMFIGSGEAATNHYNASYKHSEGEVLYLTSDNQVHIQANGQTIANRVGIQIDNSGNVVPDKVDVATNNIGSIGTSSYKFANGYFTKINGYTLAAACAKAVDTSISAASTSANLPTSAAVASFVEGKGYTSNVGTVTQVKVGSTAYNPSNGVINLPVYPIYNLTQDTTDKHKLIFSVSNAIATDVQEFTIPDNNTHRPIQVNGTEVLGNNTTALNLKAGSNVSISNSSGTVTIAATDTNTTYSAGTGLALSGTTFRTTIPRVAKDSKSMPGQCTAVIEEYTAGDSYNLPSNAWYHIYTAQGADTKYGTQLALGMTANAAYYRNYNNGTWSGWYSLINSNWTSHLYAGSGAAANASTTNGNTKLALCDNSTVRNTITIKGTGATTVTSDANGVITINSTDNNTNTLNTAGSTDTSSKIFLIGATSQAANPQTYSHDTAYVGTDGCLYSGGSKVLTAHQDISGKADKSATVSTVAWDSTNKKLTKTINGTTSDIVTGATILGGLTKSQVTTALGYTPPTTDTDTKNTAGSTDTSSKIFLIGATSQGANPQTYSHDTAYVGTDGCLYSGGAKVLTAHDGNNAVTQTATTTSANYEVLFSVTADNTTRTEGARKNSNLLFNPSTGNLQTTQLNGVTIGSNPKFTDTNTWRGVQNNLTSTATDQSLSAAQGKVLNEKITNWTAAQTLASGATSVQFTGLTAGYAYELYSETADGTPVYILNQQAINNSGSAVASASATGIKFTLKAITASQAASNGCKVKLKCLY